MNLTLIEKDRALDVPFLQIANRQLEGIVGKSNAMVSAEWKRGQDGKGNPFYTLQIADSMGQVATDFTANEFRSPRHLRIRLLELFGDLLQVRSHKLLENLTAGNGQAEERNGTQV